MKYKPFSHDEVQAGYKTACHRPRKDGTPLQLNRDGYAVVPSKRTTLTAHRVRWAEAGLPLAQILDHLCRNRWCCNPAHLESVSAAVNVRRGDCTKLDELEVATMRKLREEGASVVSVAREFGVSQSHASRITRGLYWSAGACKHWEQRKGGTGHL